MDVPPIAFTGYDGHMVFCFWGHGSERGIDSVLQCA